MITRMTKAEWDALTSIEDKPNAITVYVPVMWDGPWDEVSLSTQAMLRREAMKAVRTSPLVGSEQPVITESVVDEYKPGKTLYVVAFTVTNVTKEQMAQHKAKQKVVTDKNKKNQGETK